MKLSTLTLALTASATLAFAGCSDNNTEKQAGAGSDAGPAVTESAPAQDSTLSEKAGKLGDDAKDLGSSAWEATKEGAGNLVDSSKEAANSAAETTGDVVDTVKQKSTAAYEAVKEKGAAAYDTVKEKTSEAMDAAKESMGSDAPETPETPAAPADMPRKI